VNIPNRRDNPGRLWVVVAALLGLLLGIAQNVPMLVSHVLPALENSVEPWYPLFEAFIVINFVVMFFVRILIAAIAAAAIAQTLAANSSQSSLSAVLTRTRRHRRLLRSAMWRTRSLSVFLLALCATCFLSILVYSQNYVEEPVYLAQEFIDLALVVPWIYLALVWGVWVALRMHRPSAAVVVTVIGMFIAEVAYNAAAYCVSILYDTNQHQIPENMGVEISPELIHSLIQLAIGIAFVVPILAYFLYLTLPVRVPHFDL